MIGSEALQFIWRPEMPWLAGFALAFAALLWVARPDDRPTYRNTLGFFALGMLGLLSAGIASTAGFTVAAEVLKPAFLVVCGIAIVRLGGFTLFRVLLPALRMPTPRIVEDLVISAAYGLFAAIQLREAGVDFSGILTASAILTGLLALAMQESLGNVLGGLALQLENSIQVGDWIRVEDVTGRVTDIRWRSTSIETRNGELALIPNSRLMRDKFTLLGRRPPGQGRLRRWIRFAVDPSAPPARVIDIAQATLREADIPHVTPSPAPDCVLHGFDQGNLEYAVRYWLDDIAPDDPTDSAVRTHLFTALQRAGLRIAEPQATFHNVAVDEQHERSTRTREVERRLHFLRKVDIFATLSESELAGVAERLQYAPFASGDVITRQGNTSHWLYILVSGEAEVMVRTPGGAQNSLGMLGTGSFFGEMGLMTGAPRTATVIARSDIECYRLDKAGFQGLLLARPGLAEEIGRIVADRQPDLNSAQHDLIEPAPRNGAGYAGALVSRIRRFLGLDAPA